MEILLSLLGGGLGGLIRFLPEVLKFFADGKDRDHEFRMTQLQLEIERQKGQQQIKMIESQGEVDFNSGQMAAYVEALKGQAVKSGVKWVDALSSAVRPILTFWWMGLFTVYKLSSLWYGWQQSPDFAQFLAQLWTPQDWGIFSMILGFWFVDRAFKRIMG